MRIASSLSLIALLMLTACGKFTAADTSENVGGRYGGIGTYAADPLWKHLKGAPDLKDTDVARLKDDSQIIIVVDRQTGEVRQCGNNSGYCIGMNPWKGAASAQPARLDTHADQLEEASNGAERSANSAK